MLASAPGKVLIIGGYLIVQSPNVGTSISVNARFTTIVTKSQANAAPADGDAPATTTVHIASPQFKQDFTFVCSTTGSGADAVVKVEQTEGPASPFLCYAVLYAVTGARINGHSVGYELWLELRGDNDFYSQRNYLEEKKLPVTAKNLREVPKQHPLVGAVSKTGIGSSAAMTTSVVACLLAQFRGEPDVPVEFVHRVAQIAHSVSQGKIGSGFDVFTAVYGSCAYRRFPAKCVEAIMADGKNPDSCRVGLLDSTIEMKNEWVAFNPFHLPRGFHLLLGDIHCGGSSTPGMVSKMMAWQRSVAEQPDNLWEKLRVNNEKYIECLNALCAAAAAHESEYSDAISTAGSMLQQNAPKTEIDEKIVAAAKVAARSRELLREMGNAAGVALESPEITKLLDATQKLPGVFAVGCPGAGGNDAVFALVIGDEGTCDEIGSFWEAYTDLNVCPLLVREDARGILINKS